jgi:hypothetical protein
MSPENPLAIVRELCDRLGLSPEERRDYERRLGRAVWLDRAEVLEVAGGAFSGTDAETDEPGGWAR